MKIGKIEDSELKIDFWPALKLYIGLHIISTLIFLGLYVFFLGLLILWTL